MTLWGPRDNEVSRNKRDEGGFVNRGRMDKMGRNYGFLSAENKQRVSGEMDSGTKEPKRSGDSWGQIDRTILTFVII